MTSDQLEHPAAESFCLGPDCAPGWLVQVATLIFDCADDRFRSTWAPQLRTALAGLDGTVPFRVFHDWHANTISSLVIESCSQKRLSAQEHEDLAELHHGASRGCSFGEQTWRDTLEPALHALYLHSYPYNEAFELATRFAESYARSHGYTEDGARTYGRTYAELNTGANTRLFSSANAKSNSRAYAAAFAHSNHNLLAQSYPGAYIRACMSLIPTEHSSGPAAYTRLGTGLIESMGRT